MPEQPPSIALPLAGKRILITRTREQASVLSKRLAVLGAITIEFPTIRIVPPADWSVLDNALDGLFRMRPRIAPASTAPSYPSHPRIPARGILGMGEREVPIPGSFSPVPTLFTSVVNAF